MDRIKRKRVVHDRDALQRRRAGILNWRRPTAPPAPCKPEPADERVTMLFLDLQKVAAAKRRKLDPAQMRVVQRLEQLTMRNIAAHLSLRPRGPVR